MSDDEKDASDSGEDNSDDEADTSDADKDNGTNVDNDVGKSQSTPTCPQNFDKDITYINNQNWETEMTSRMGDFEALLGRADISVVIMEIVVLNGWDLDLLIDNNTVKVSFANRKILSPILLHCLNLACELKNLNWGTRFITSYLVFYSSLIFLMFVSLLHITRFRCM